MNDRTGRGVGPPRPRTRCPPRSRDGAEHAMEHEPELTYESIAKRIDHSLLPPTLTDDELAAGCRLAARYQVASVCIKPYAVAMAADLLHGTGVLVGTTVGFPHGGHATAVKVFEAEHAMSD